eukprot:CAMPEP_0173438668 /NCGR_PEP_ID=MMETSP1357-20121228/20539_1 /TAXON_ID=77926 /ORGANISM="Hemiselmis rufescens, Strain PCC563" /LENGTH=158 /DNA_ID=CAMNT_0014403979 /DNA_START=27 /DNA_END=500 /DNA_ORIENTATION=-
MTGHRSFQHSNGVMIPNLAQQQLWSKTGHWQTDGLSSPTSSEAYPSGPSSPSSTRKSPRLMMSVPVSPGFRSSPSRSPKSLATPPPPARSPLVPGSVVGGGKVALFEETYKLRLPSGEVHHFSTLEALQSALERIPGALQTLKGLPWASKLHPSARRQ